MTRYEVQEPRTRPNSISAAWSYLWRGSKHYQNQHILNGASPSTRSADKQQTIAEEDDEDRVLGKGITRKVLPQQRRSTSSTQSSPAGSSRTSPRLEPSKVSDQQQFNQQLQPSALERIAIHNGNINNALASTMHHSNSLSPLTKVDEIKDTIYHGNKDNIPKKLSKSARGLSSSSSSSSPPPTVGLGLVGINGSREPSDLPPLFAAPISGPSYFDITPSSQANTTSAPTKKSSGFTTKTSGRRTKRTPAHSISSTITNSGMSNSRRVSCADTASQNSATFIDDQDLEIDENSFYSHLQKMQERFQVQQEPGWLKTQHAILQTKHRTQSSGSPQPDNRGAFGGKKSGLFNRIHSSSSSPNSSDYSSSPSFHFGPQHSRQSSCGTNSPQQQQPVHSLNCFQPGNVICVPRERSLGGLIFHKTFVETHVLTPSPYYRGQYLTLDHKVVEIDRDYVREISGFSHPRSVQILSEETVYNGISKKGTKVLVLERPLEGNGVVQTRAIEGPMMPNLRQFTSDMAFIESFPELSRALCDFNNLCREFENTYVYIRGFAAYTLEKLRLIYEKVYSDCVGDSVKLQKILNQGVQAEQECFAELMENIVLGKLYQKLFIHSLMPCYVQRDVEIDAVITKYHQHFFGVGSHRGIDGGVCLAATDNPMLHDALKRLGLSEKWRNMRVDHALDGAAGLFRAWDKGEQDDSSPLSLTSQRIAAANLLQESEQEMKRQQLRESLRIFVQDDKYKSEKQPQRFGSKSHEDESEMSNEDEEEQEDMTANAIWNTPLEKAYCIKLVLDMIATVAEDHLMNGQSFSFMQKKRSEVSVTTDDFIPLLAIVIIQAKIMHLGSNIFYLQRFRINTPKPDLNFALVTLEATIEFLKTDPLGLLDIEQSTISPSASLGSGSRTSLQGSQPIPDIEKLISTEDVQALSWGTPSHTGWGFSPPRSSETSTYDSLTPSSEKPLHTVPSESSSARPAFAIRGSDSSQQFQQDQQRHARSASVNFDDRIRRVVQVDETGGGSSNNSSWSRSPMLGPRFTSGTNSPLAASASPTYNVFSNPTEAGSGPIPRRPSHQLTHMPQRHSISSGQVHMHTHAQHNHYQNRVSLDQGRDSFGRSTLMPLPSPNLTPQLVVKPQIMLPPPKTPPMSGQNTSTRARPMSMIAVGALASSTYSNSYGGSGTTSSRRSFSSNHSSPATSPRLGPGLGSRQSNSRSNSLMSGPFPIMRANSMSTVVTADDLPRGANVSQKNMEQTEPLSPVSPMSPWAPRATIQPFSQSSLLSDSPPQLESPVLTEPPAGMMAPQTPEAPKLISSRTGVSPPGRIRMSLSSTVSSISTPTTPSTFSSADGNALLDSLNANSQLTSPPTPTSTTPTSFATGLPVLSAAKSLPGFETVAPPTSSAPSNAPSSARPLSIASKQPFVRRHIPKLSLSLSHSPSAPSTAFCRTTVTAAATHATTSIDDLEPASTILPTDQYGGPTTTVMPPTPSSADPSGRHNISNDDQPSSARLREAAALHQKTDSGKYVGYQSGGAGHSSNHSSSSSRSYSSASNSTFTEHSSHGTALNFEQSFRDDLCLDPQVSDRRRGSATSLRTKSVGNYQPEKVILLWNQSQMGSVIDGGGPRVGAGSSSRLAVSSGDLPSSTSSSSSSPFIYQRPFTPTTSSFMIGDPQQRTQMMGDFLSELAKVEDGDVLVGNGRNGVMSRQ
ncbi:hypothetical protein BGX27_000743 [Mortierella sp. AM989]|nr:hypothetical protein BGX27_000743 [Mortierella sp. AM989]